LSSSNEIVALNPRGEGVTAGGRAAPGLLPGDIDGEAPKVARATPICHWFGTCGGCAAQHMPTNVYADWKRGSVVAALARAGVAAEVGPPIDAHGEGRRRATFHARTTEQGQVEVGLMRARAHEIVDIDACPLFAPALKSAPAVARAVAEALKGTNKPLDIQITATLTGLDVDFRGCGALPPSEARKATEAAQTLDLARLSNHGVALIERRAPLVAFGTVRAALPPGGFLQATEAGEAALAGLALDALKGAGRVADLFCGAGAFALRLAAIHATYAADNDAAAVAALRRAAAQTARGVEAQARDLFRHPLSAAELARFDAVLFDPPRAGAEAQTRQIAASGIMRVVAISCNAESFARDASVLLDEGYVCEGVTPIDQFRFSAHVEIFAAFRRVKPKKRRSLLG
jgi:23S rRNA (uracil1939-C5)-methyltransferase